MDGWNNRMMDGWMDGWNNKLNERSTEENDRMIDRTKDS